ncbi:MAG: response regulator [Phycisphaerae bacterium]|jgi:PAS domain S-box-containing protein
MKILIVDDKEEGRYMFESLLKGSGYEVITAANGAEATEILQDNPVGLIVSDILMPKMDGFAFCRHCKSDDNLREIPFIFYTATYTNKKDEEFALSLGADKFLVKPIEPKKLLKVVKEVIEKSDSGGLRPVVKPENEEVFLTQYNKRLVEKLEDKALNLEKELAERKKAELAMRLSEQRFRAIADYTYSWELWISHGGNLIWTSPAVYKITGFSVGECMGMKDFPLSLVDIEDRDKAAPIFKPVSIDSRGEDVEFRIVHKLGTTVWVSACWQPIRDVKGSPQGFRVGISDITKRKEAEEKLRGYHTNLKAMAISSLLVEERERNRVAQELHDDIIQKLAMMKIGLQTSFKAQDGSISPELFKKLCFDIDAMIDKVRSLTFDLSNPVLNELGLEAAIERLLVKELQEKNGIEFEFNRCDRLDILKDDLNMCLYRSVRELLNNVIKHSQAQKVIVSISIKKDDLIIEIQDNGVGFDPCEANAKIGDRGTFGLFSVQEQLKSFRGWLKIESKQGQGSRMTIIVPVMAAARV